MSWILGRASVGTSVGRHASVCAAEAGMFPADTVVLDNKKLLLVCECAGLPHRRELQKSRIALPPLGMLWPATLLVQQLAAPLQLMKILPVRLNFHSCEAERSQESTDLTHRPPPTHHACAQSWGNSSANAKRSLDSESFTFPPRAMFPPM